MLRDRHTIITTTPSAFREIFSLLFAPMPWLHVLDKIQEILFFGIIDFFPYYMNKCEVCFSISCTWTDLHIDTYHFVHLWLCTNDFYVCNSAIIYCIFYFHSSCCAYKYDAVTLCSMHVVIQWVFTAARYGITNHVGRKLHAAAVAKFHVGMLPNAALLHKIFFLLPQNSSKKYTTISESWLKLMMSY